MGSTTYSDDVYREATKARAMTNTPRFEHDADVRAGRAKSILHETLDILGKDRESRDSPAHPRSKAIAVMFDHTGSMRDVPRVLQTKLPMLMAMLLSKGYCVDPQILFGAIGDAFDGSKAPLQVGQFESGNEMDDTFGTMVLEGKGGGTLEESYELAMYYFARHVSMDCFEKRGDRGYLFIIGDENPYPQVSATRVREIVGDRLQSDLSTEDVVEELLAKFEVFYLIPYGTSNYDNLKIQQRWSELIGAQRVVKLRDPAAVCEAIAAIVGIHEGAVDANGLAQDLQDVGASASVVAAVTGGLSNVARTAPDRRARAGTGTG